MKDTFEEVYKNIGIALSNLSYWNVDSLVDRPEGFKGINIYKDDMFKDYYIDHTDTKNHSGYIYLPYNNKFIKVFFYE